MECPKCGAAQAEEREDCTACGVIFERWRLMQERATLLEKVQVSPAPAPERGIPAWMAIAGLVVIVLLGSMWTMRNRAARAKNAPSDDLLNEINNKVVKARMAVEADQARAAGNAHIAMQNAAATPAPAKPKELHWPEGLAEAEARRKIELCPAFTLSHDLATPKVFTRASKSAVMQQFTWLPRAVQKGYVELDETTHRELGLIEAKIVPSAWSKVPFVDNGTHFELRLGRPRITKITGVRPTNNGAQVWFDWEFDGGKGGDLLLDPSAWHARAGFVRTNGIWSLRNVWITNALQESSVCS